MKFYSKYTNYRVVLKSGTPAIPLAGKAKVDTISVKFIDNRLNVDDSKEDLIELLMSHQSYGKDFWCEDEESNLTEKNPFLSRQKAAEPHHVITEVEKGALGKSYGSKPSVHLNAEQMAFAKELAKNMASEMIQKLIEKKHNEAATDKNSDVVDSYEVGANDLKDKEKQQEEDENTGLDNVASANKETKKYSKKIGSSKKK